MWAIELNCGWLSEKSGELIYRILLLLEALLKRRKEFFFKLQTNKSKGIKEENHQQNFESQKSDNWLVKLKKC